MERGKSWQQVTEIGSSVKSRWKTLVENHGLVITICGLPPIASFDLSQIENLCLADG
jgi:hypothetical protein